MGWRGVTDPSHLILAVDYDAVEGLLLCRLKDYIYGYYGVPESIHLVLLKHPFAASYWRKKVKDKFRCERMTLDGTVLGEIPPFVPNPEVMREIEEKRMAKRLKAVKRVMPMETNLFGEIIGSRVTK